MALPRVGMGVGGLLLGTRQGGVVQLLDSIEIPCSHAGGPSFNLSDEEKELLRELIAGAGKPGVIGWYCSRTRGAAALGDSEMALDREFFAGQGQISLVLRPSAGEPTRAAFFFRDAKGNVVKGVECDVDEWRPGEAEIEPVLEEQIPREAIAPIAATTPVPEKERPVVSAPVVSAPVVSAPVVTAPVVTAPVVAAPRAEPHPVPDAVADMETRPPAAISEPLALPRETPRVVPVKAPPAKITADPALFAFAGGPPRRKARFLWIFGAVALLATGAGAFFTQDYWLPRPPLTLSSTESDGNLVIRWNVDALRGIDRASMFVNDGGDLQSLPLDRFQINQGVLIYKPKSERVTAKLSAGEASAIAVWLKPVPAAPAAEASPPGADVPATPAPQATTPAQDTPAPSTTPPAGKR